MMNREPSHSPAENMNEHAAKESVWRRVWNSLIHNWGWKLLSLALAVCLWGVLISQDNALPRDKEIDGVRVVVSNAAALRSNGLIVVDGLQDVETAAIRARVPQKNYPSASAAHYTVRLDLSQIQEAGEQTVTLTASAANTAQYGTVLEVLHPDVTLQVEEYVTQRRVPVEVRQIGEAPEGCYPGEMRKTADYVDVSGPKSVVEAAVRCVVEYDLTNLSPKNSPNAVSLPFFFEDRQGAPLDGSNLTVVISEQYSAISRIGITQNVYYMAQVPVDVSAAVVGQPKEGYAVKEIRVVPETVTLLSESESVIAPYREEGAKIYPTSQIDISDKDTVTPASLSLFIPEEITNSAKINSALVIVTILPDAFVNPASDGGTENTP